MEEKVLLEVSQHQGCFHFNTDDKAIAKGIGDRFDDWTPLGVMFWSQASRFTHNIWHKYHNHLPDMQTLEKEFKSFVLCIA